MKRSALIVLLTAVCLSFPFAAPAVAQVNAGTDASAELSPPVPAEGFTIGILGDRTGGEESGLAVLELAVAELNLLKPAFVVHIGDMVPGYIRDMRQWERDVRRVKEILDRLEVPFFPVAGNHDVITGTDDPDDHRGEELYKRYFGPLYYSFDQGKAHFVFLYTEEALQSRPRFSRVQLEWLRQDLSRSEAQHVFVFMHKPLWEYADAGWDEVHAILRQHPVRAVIAGHFHHYYRSKKQDGIQYYVIGVTGGQLFSPELAGGLEHYCLLRIERDGHRLALVKPGYILPDDHIDEPDYKNMEVLRRLSRQETGVAAAIRSPELRAVDERLAVRVANPLDRPLRAVVRGVSRGGSWTFSPPATALIIEPGRHRYAYLGVRSGAVLPARLVVPEVEIQYTYVDAKGRSVPIVLSRRVPLVREVTAALGKPVIALDGRSDEGAWRTAPVLTTAIWQTSPYETGEAGPVFRVLTSGAGIYFHVESKDADISSFQGHRILSDALFVGAVSAPEKQPAADLTDVPVVVIFPFGPAGAGQALRAFWDPKRPVGLEAPGVHIASFVRPDGTGWRCEGFVPWDVLLAQGAEPGEEVYFNIGAWDNDGDLFTELHSWAPTGDASQWGRLVLKELACE